MPDACTLSGGDSVRIRVYAFWTATGWGRWSAVDHLEELASARRQALLMDVLILTTAVTVKELRLYMRGWRVPAVITLYLLALGIMAFAPLAAMWHGSVVTVPRVATAGADLFTLLSLLQLSLLVFVAPISTASALSGERQRGTMDLLLVSRLPSAGIVLGKLAAALAFDLLLLLCSLPLFGMSWILGGAAPEQIAEESMLTLGTVLVLSAAGLCVSAVTARVSTAALLSNLFAFGLVFGLALALVTLAPQQVVVYRYGLNGMLLANGGVPVPPQLPWPAYIDPLFALLAVLPPAPSALVPAVLLNLGSPIHDVAGLPVELWQCTVAIHCSLSLLFVLISSLVVRPRRSSRRVSALLSPCRRPVRRV